jgi:D-alanine transaminase
MRFAEDAPRAAINENQRKIFAPSGIVRCESPGAGHLMSRIAYVNGRYVPHGAALVHVEDRGYQFADGVYEVCAVREGRLVDERRHLQRLVRSLTELRIVMPMPPAALGVVLRETVRRNRVRGGLVYLQVTRGVARRDFLFPGADLKPSVVVTARHLDQTKLERTAAEGIAVVTMPDNRWERVDIKSVSLLPNVLAKQAAKDAGAREAWLVDKDGFVTEGASSNAWIVTGDGKLVTRPADHGILRGVTRSVVLDLIAACNLGLEERKFSVAEAYGAREAFVTSANQIVMPVVSIDGRPVGNGAPGLVAAALRRDFFACAEIS